MQNKLHFLQVTEESKLLPAPTARTEVTIIVTDVNDETPTFRSPRYIAEIHENAVVNSPVTFLSQVIPQVYDYDQVSLDIHTSTWKKSTVISGSRLKSEEFFLRKEWATVASEYRTPDDVLGSIPGRSTEKKYSGWFYGAHHLEPLRTMSSQ